MSVASSNPQVAVHLIISKSLIILNSGNKQTFQYVSSMKMYLKQSAVCEYIISHQTCNDMI